MLQNLGLVDQNGIPVRSPLDSLPQLPDGSPDYRFLLPSGFEPVKGEDNKAQWVYSQTAAPADPLTWIRDHQHLVLGISAALLLLAVMRPRR